jgi:hypothetical protein
MVHVVLDNYATHKHPKVLAWLARHPRFVFHFTPTSASWLNAVEGLFAKLTNRRLKRGVFRSIVELQAAINAFIAEVNDNPKPFIWTADPDKIIAAIKRGHQRGTPCCHTAGPVTESPLALQRIGPPKPTNRLSALVRSSHP